MTAQTELFDGLLADVITLTNRPDLEDETNIALRTATLSAHSSAAFPRDVVTQQATLPTPAYLISMDIQLLFPRLRGISTVRNLDSTYSPMSHPEIEIVEMGDIYDGNGNIKNDTAYIAGSSLNARTSVPSYGLLVEYFQLPLVRREQYNSWIALLQPEVILFGAASIVLSTNGGLERANKYQELVEKKFHPELLANFLTSAMR